MESIFLTSWVIRYFYVKIYIKLSHYVFATHYHYIWHSVGLESAVEVNLDKILHVQYSGISELSCMKQLKNYKSSLLLLYCILN